MSNERFLTEASRADVVITHAGVGTILQLLDLGVFPLVAPRLAVHREHVDDHQMQIARELDRFGLATVARAAELDRDSIASAASRRVIPVGPSARSDGT